MVYSLYNSLPSYLQKQEQTLVVNVNVEKEGEIRQIFQDILNPYTPMAVEELSRRVGYVEQAFIRATAIGDPSFSCLSNPAVHSMMSDTVKAAAETSEEKDLELLGRLLAERKGLEGDKSMCHGLKKAIEVIPFISEQSLLGLTIVSMFIKECKYYDTYTATLDKMESIFGTLPLDKLPYNSDWVDELAMCNAAIPKMGEFKKLDDFICEALSMYLILGLERDGEEHKEAISAIESVSLSTDNVFVENELMPNFVRLFFLEENIDRIGILKGDGSRDPLSSDMREVFLKIFKKYKVDETKKQQMKNELIRQWDARPCLKTIHEWWNKNTKSLFHPSSIGYSLAYVNAKYYNNDITDFLHS